MRFYKLSFLFLTCFILTACDEKPKVDGGLACHNTPQGCSAADMKKATGYNQ